MRSIGIVFALIALLLVLVVGTVEFGVPDVSQEVAAAQAIGEDGGLYEPSLTFQAEPQVSYYNTLNSVARAIAETDISLLTSITATNTSEPNETATNSIRDNRPTTGRALKTGDVSSVLT